MIINFYGPSTKGRNAGNINRDARIICYQNAYIWFYVQADRKFTFHEGDVIEHVSKSKPDSFWKMDGKINPNTIKNANLISEYNQTHYRHLLTVLNIIP